MCAPFGGSLRCAFCRLAWVGRARARVAPARVPPQQDSGGRAGFIGVRPMRRACALGKRRGPIPAVAKGLGLRGPPAPTGFRPPPRLGNTPALPWQGARPLTRRLRPPLPRLRGCVAVWGCARVVRLRARGLAGGCAGSPPSGPLRGVAWALHGGGLGGRPLGRPFGRVAPPAVAPCGLCAPCLFGPSCGACLLPSPPFWSSHCSALSRTAAPPLARSRGAKSAPCWPRPSAPKSLTGGAFP